MWSLLLLSWRCLWRRCCGVEFLNCVYSIVWPRLFAQLAMVLTRRRLCRLQFIRSYALSTSRLFWWNIFGIRYKATKSWDCALSSDQFNLDIYSVCFCERRQTVAEVSYDCRIIWLIVIAKNRTHNVRLSSEYQNSKRRQQTAAATATAKI